MVILSVAGGLGNQMFQYAMGRHLAHRKGVELKLDLSQFESGGDRRPRGLEGFRRKFSLNHFGIVASEASKTEIAAVRDRFFPRSIQSSIVWRARRVAPRLLWPATHIREKSYRFDPEMLRLPSHVYLQGYWQSEKYFSDIADIIRRDLTFKDAGIAAYANQYVDRLRALGGPVVSLHVRRGDLAHANDALKRKDLVYGVPVGLNYISAAISRFPASCQFLVFSDTPKDIEWCRQNISGSRIHFSEEHSDVQDLSIMSACDHHIIANSTFSWWGAWLNDKVDRRVVAPRRWSSPTSTVQMDIDDLLPPSWEIL